MSINTDEVSAVVKQFIKKEVPDALMKQNAFWNSLMKRLEYVPGGVNLQFPIKAIANASAGFISGGAQAVNVNQSQQVVYGALNWKHYYYNVSFTLDEMTKALESPEAVINFFKQKKEGGKSDAIRGLSSAVFTSATAAPLAINGLADIVAASGTAYAGLTDTDYATGVYLPIIDTSTSVVAYDPVNLMINKVKARAQQSGENANGIDMGFCNENVYGQYLSSVQNQQRFYESTMVSTGFDGFKVNGVNIYMDANSQGSKDGSTGDNYLYVFPSSIMTFCYRWGLAGKESPFDGKVRITNQPVESNQSYISGNLMCNNRRLIGVFKNLVA